jgi:hypothetical protein
LRGKGQSGNESHTTDKGMSGQIEEVALQEIVNLLQLKEGRISRINR